VAGVARVVDELLADPERLREMGAAGRRAWEERFSWDAVSGRYEDLYLSLAGAA
jgi:glycosyltransferase involved in cell wall biosynthesis